jgi:crossover junction endodeoxyribonuclease RuvC
MILALDIATRMGWALGEPGDVPVSGTVRFGSDDASLWARYHHALRWAIDRFVHGQQKITKLVIEDQLNPQAFSSKEGAELLYGLPAIIGACAYDRRIYEIERHKVADVRGFFINRRGLKTDDAKVAVMRRCRKLGWPVIDHNAADACALWAYECSRHRSAQIVHQLARCGL